MKYNYLLKSLGLIISAGLLSACGSDDAEKTLEPFDGLAVIQASGENESNIEFTDGISEIESGFNVEESTDYAVFTHGEYFYHLGKGSNESLQKYHIEEPELGYYPNDGFSLRGANETTSANPHYLVFLGDDANTGVITRYGSTEAWVVNLDASVSEDFVIDTLDLSAHSAPISDTDTDPEMSMAFIYDEKLFITLQNLDVWTATTNAKVVVFDTNTWQEIDTDTSTQGTQAISLTLQNHQSSALYGDQLYLGSLVYGSPNTGGIELINLSTYSTEVLIDDKAVSKIAATKEGNIFFSDYASWENNSLYKLNSDNSYQLVSSELEGINITAFASPDMHVWLGTNSFENKNQIYRIDGTLDYSLDLSLNDVVISSVETNFKPIQISFMD
ncbi:hypothetical protein NBRC116188_19240 [Oceaniserpentilla sp. 4NH20-0058]|uniref:hypothetical protein n=1 Tax=Oceaniserpentilla sp. 4NH20-0058 TaxID=3127660 RepID=UPI00310858C6